MSKDDGFFDSTNISLSYDVPAPSERRSGDRELTILRIAKLITDNGEELCRIRNISAGGAKAETSIDHAVGERIVLELHTDQRLVGSVAWSRDASMGVRFDECVNVAQVLAKASDDERRYAQPRVHAPCIARLSIDSVSHKVPVTDISQGGMKVEIDAPICVGARVAVTIEGLPRIEGVVRWSRDDQAGIAFNGQVPFDQLTRWLGARLAGRRAASSGGEGTEGRSEDRAA